MDLKTKHFLEKNTKSFAQVLITLIFITALGVFGNDGVSVSQGLVNFRLIFDIAAIIIVSVGFIKLKESKLFMHVVSSFIFLPMLCLFL